MRKQNKIIIVLFTLLLSQIILFGLSSVFGIKGKLLSVVPISSPETTIKKFWLGIFLVIEGRTVISCQEPLDHIKVVKNAVLIDSSRKGEIQCWGYKDRPLKYAIVYNNIFSALEAYIFNDTININIDYSIIPSSYIQQKNQTENQEKDFKEAEEKYTEPTNTGVRLAPTPERGTSSQGGELRAHYIYSETMDIAAGQKWNKDTKLKYCIRYKSNTDSPNYRSAVLYANSSLENKYIFQIDLYEYQTDYHCSQSAWAKGIWDKNGGRGTYNISIPFKASFSSKDVFHEICVDDINSQLNHCASKWGISENDAYVTNIYQTSASSSASNLSDYTILDYFRIFIDGNRVSEPLFPNQDFSEFSGLADDNSPDDFVGWTEHSNIYAVDIEE